MNDSHYEKASVGHVSNEMRKLATTIGEILQKGHKCGMCHTARATRYRPMAVKGQELVCDTCGKHTELRAIAAERKRQNEWLGREEWH